MKDNTAGITLIMVGVIFVIFGMNRGEALEVMLKAVTICLECIGIG